LKKNADGSIIGEVRKFVKFFRLELILLAVSYVIALLIPVWNFLYRIGSMLVIFILFIIGMEIIEKIRKKYKKFS